MIRPVPNEREHLLIIAKNTKTQFIALQRIANQNFIAFNCTQYEEHVKIAKY